MGKRRRVVKQGKSRHAAMPAAQPPALPGAIPPVLGIGLLLVVAGLGWWLTIGRHDLAENTPSPTAAVQSIGGVTGCRGLPRFAERLGYKDRLGIGTSERTYSGLVIFDGRVPLTADPAERDIYQEPSWDAAGTLGAFVLDREGHIYTIPVPRTAVSDNPPGSLNTIYKIDSDTAELQPFLTLPGEPAGSSVNPFGLLGITYDCDTHALYVSTVAGSSRQAEQGRVVRVDLATGQLSDEVIGVDAIGLAIFQGRNEKRLYMGLARNAELGSVALDEAGHATGAFRSDLLLEERPASFAEPRVRRITFEQGIMTLFVVPFNFNLRAVSEQQQLVVQYGYDAENDSWSLIPE